VQWDQIARDWRGPGLSDRVLAGRRAVLSQCQACLGGVLWPGWEHVLLLVASSLLQLCPLSCRRHDSSGSGQSAFEPLVANGAPASLIPKPGSLKRGLASQCPDDCLNKRSRTSSMSSLNNTYTSGIPSSLRNAIASSYSSSRGLTQLWKRSGVSVSPLSSPASSRPQTPEWPLKKAREEDLHRSNTSTPVKSDKELQTEKAVETPVRRKRGSLSPPAASGSSGKRKRKIQLLSSCRGDQLALPPPPQLGYSITSEDLDAEKKAALQWFNKVLEDKADPVPISTTAETTPASRPLAFTVTTGTSSAPASTAPVPASSNLLLDSLKKMQDSQAAPVPADSSGAAIAFQPSSSASQLPGPAVSLESSSLPATSADTKPVSVLSTAALSVSPASGAQPASSVAPPATTELGPTPSKPPSVLKPNILFGAPSSSPPASQPAMTAAAAVPTTTPVFKPIFGALPKSESTAPATTVISTAVTVSVSSAPSSAPSTTTVFKPIFGSVTAASSPAKVSPFAFKPLSQPASAAEVPAASTTTGLAGFTALPNVIFTTAATTATTLNSSTDATIKPVFSFGLNPPASISTSLTVTATAATSASQPFMFGGLSSSATSTAPTFATPVFQFGKPAAATVSATTSVAGGPAFGQAPAISAAPTTTVGFSLFGSTTLTSSAPATTGQPAPTFGSSSSAFGSTFSTNVKPLPPYSGAASQPAFSAGAADSQLPGSKPAAGHVGFAPPFSFGAPTQRSADFGTGGTQAAFGTTTSVFSFGTPTSTTASFGSGTQTSSSGVGTAVFGTAPSPFTFGAAAQPGPSAGAFGLSTPALSGGSPAVPFSFGAGQSGAAAAATPFGSSLTQSALGAPSQSTPFAFTVPSTPDAKPVFGGTPAPTFGQSTPVPGAVGSGSSSLSFGTPSAPASAFPGVGPSTPAFSIGAGSKTGARQRLQARRQHTRKK
uniref:POM121 transmembrane nucleoporin C n=1 Tax=Meleagris gallopavo TaxID=9103 RepID=G1MSA2_MELGA